MFQAYDEEAEGDMNDLDLSVGLPGTVGRACFDRPVAVIGDIHGRLDLLDQLLRRLPARMPIVVVGDVIDRGPDSRGVIERLLQRGAIGVRGNHEEWFIRWATGQGLDRAALNLKLCGAPTLRSYGVNTLIPAEIETRRDRVPDAHRAWLCGLPVALDLEVRGDRYWVIHAGVPSTVELAGLMIHEVVPHLAEQHPASLTWPSNDPEMMLPVDRPVIMGHVGQRRARDLGT